MNHMKTFVLLAGLTALLVLIGGALGGKVGIIIAVLFAVVMNFGSYWYSDKIILKIYKAKEVSRGQTLHTIVEELAQKANLPMPKVYIRHFH